METNLLEDFCPFFKSKDSKTLWNTWLWLVDCGILRSDLYNDHLTVAYNWPLYKANNFLHNCASLLYFVLSSQLIKWYLHLCIWQMLLSKATCIHAIFNQFMHSLGNDLMTLALLVLFELQDYKIISTQITIFARSSSLLIASYLLHIWNWIVKHGFIFIWNAYASWVSKNCYGRAYVLWWWSYSVLMEVCMPTSSWMYTEFSTLRVYIAILIAGWHLHTTSGRKKIQAQHSKCAPFSLIAKDIFPSREMISSPVLQFKVTLISN